MRGVAVVVAVLAALPLDGVAAAAPEPDREIAERHFEAGRERYDHGDYAAAAREFEAARAVAPVPAFDFNIARCYDRLERWAEAAAAYQRYVGAAPSATDAEEVRARIAVLNARAAQARTAPAAPPPPSRHVAPIAVGAAAVVALAVGGGLIGWVATDYDRLHASCGSSCSPQSWQDLPGRADAGYALVAVGGALAAVDVVLWVLDARAGRRARASLRADAGGLRVTW